MAIPHPLVFMCGLMIGLQLQPKILPGSIQTRIEPSSILEMQQNGNFFPDMHQNITFSPNMQHNCNSPDSPNWSEGIESARNLGESPLASRAFLRGSAKTSFGTKSPISSTHSTAHSTIEIENMHFTIRIYSRDTLQFISV